MKFYELDLRQIIPYGIPLNTDSHVEYTGYINDFFLQGFENYFSQLFKVENNELVIDYSRSCAAPDSLFACEFCSDNQLEDAITGAGFKYYTTNDHAVNAKFVYDLNNIQFGTEGWLTAAAQYAANSRNIIAKPVYGDKGPYHYGIYLSGDITSSANTSTILNRMIENLKVVGTAHTQVDEFSIEDTSSQIETNVAVGAIDASILCEVEIPVVPAPDAGTSNEIEVVFGGKYQDGAWKASSIIGGSHISVNLIEDMGSRLAKFGLLASKSSPFPFGRVAIGTNKTGSLLDSVYTAEFIEAYPTTIGIDGNGLAQSEPHFNVYLNYSIGHYVLGLDYKSSMPTGQDKYTYYKCRIKLKEGYVFAGEGAIKHPWSSGDSANWSVQLGGDYANYNGNGYFTVKHSDGTYHTYNDKFTNGLGALAISEYSEYTICQVIIEV